MKPKRDDDHRTISRWIIITIILFLLALGYLVIDTFGQQPRQWMVLRYGFLGLDFDCVSEYPYTATGTMAWTSTDGFGDITERPFLTVQVVEVVDCNLDNVYLTADGNRHFRLAFTERVTDSHENHRHPVAAEWVVSR